MDIIPHLRTGIKIKSKINLERTHKNMNIRNIFRSKKTERTAAIERISNIIDTYATDEQEVRELERIITGWILMKHRLREKARQEQNGSV